MRWAQLNTATSIATLEQAKQRGFTIVELLIVIVVIAILAAISIVAYTGIQNRANDATVQSDLRSVMMKVLEYHALEGSYPVGQSTNAPAGTESVRIATGAYATSMNNFYYCRGFTSDNQERAAVVAESKSGNRYSYESVGGLKPFTGHWGNSYGGTCNSLGIVNDLTYSLALNASGGGWRFWR